MLLVSGDPVGPEAAIPALLRELSLFAETRGLQAGGARRGRGGAAALGAARAAVPLPGRRGGGRHSRSFSLEGRAIRKVRQSVTRLEKQGYAAELRRAARSSPTRSSPSWRP